jgi:hypothetical protein
MRSFTEAEQRGINLMPIADLDKQIMSGNWCPVCINDGKIIGTDDEE